MVRGGYRLLTSVGWRRIGQCDLSMVFQGYALWPHLSAGYCRVRAALPALAQGLISVFARARAARGETVGLRLDPAGCHVFAR